MKIDTFTAITLTAIVGISLVLLTNANAETPQEERYMHHCSTNPNNPTIVGPHVITRAIASIEFRKFYPGTNPRLWIIKSTHGEHVKARVILKGAQKICHFRSTDWKVKFYKYPKSAK